MKKLLSVLLALCLLAAPIGALAAVTGTDAVVSDTDAVVTGTDAGTPVGEEPALPETQVYKSVADVARLIVPMPGEIRIAPAVLTTEEGEQDVYFVAIRGAGIDLMKANNAIACFLSAFNLESRYYRLVRDAIFQNVPEGAKIVYAGHSLGGMIGQQLSCAAEFTSRYELLNTLNMGSPAVLTKNENREGPLVRCVDKQDVIPKMSPCALVNLKHYNDCIKLDGGYLGDPDSAHNKSYQREDLWGGYDALGVKGGSATITVNTADGVLLSV